MNVLSLFAATVFAAELIVSPLADDLIHHVSETDKPHITFGQLMEKSAPVVLGTNSEASPSIPPATPTPTPHRPTPTSTVVPTITPAPYKPAKKAYTIALLGDSMIDTLGADVPHLQTKLKQLFPGTVFTLLNHGVGATNIDYGFTRLTTDYTYLDKPMPSLISQTPDMVVVESFGYNPYSYDEGALDKHWLTLATIVDTLRTNVPNVKIIIAATIAPNSKTFGDGAPGLSFHPEDKMRRTAVIKQYLDSTVKFAQSQNLPLADAFHASLDKNGDGKLVYINGGDHIHYSDAGRALFAQKVADAIVTNRLLE